MKTPKLLKPQITFEQGLGGEEGFLGVSLLGRGELDDAVHVVNHGHDDTGDACADLKMENRI